MYILVFNAHITLGMVITPNTRGQWFVLNLSRPNMKKDKLFLSLYDQLCGAQCGEIGR